METANDTAMHITETKTVCSGPDCPITKTEDITKDQEEELLGGNSEDGDEEDALSDDSMRLRLSDDDAEVDETSSEQPGHKKGDQQGRNMELGSDVTATNTSESKNAMRIEKLSNGMVAFENKNIRVKQEDQGSNDSFADDFIPNTHGFYYTSENSEYCNGNVTQTKTQSIVENPEVQNQKNQWKFSGHFGEYSNRANKNFKTKKHYSTSTDYTIDTYKNKYYNTNSYYSSGKTTGRGYKSNSKKSLIRDENSDEKSSPRDRSPQIATGESETVQTEDALSRTIKSEPTATIEPSESHEDTTIEAESQSIACNETREAIADVEATNEPSTDVNHDAETVSIKVDSSVDSKTQRITDPSDETSPAVATEDRESSDEIVEADVETPEVDDPGIDDSRVVAGENLPEVDDDAPAKIESRPESPKESIDDADKPDVDSRKIDENATLQKTDECASQSDLVENSTEQSPTVNELTIDNVEVEDSEKIESNDDISLETAELELVAEIQKIDAPTEVHDEQSNEMESRETMNLVDDDAATEPTVAAAASVEQCETVVSKEASQEPSVIETKNDETVERDVVTDSEKVITECQTVDTVETHIADLPDEKLTSEEDESEGNDVKITHSSLKRTSTDSLDEMLLFRRMRIRRKDGKSVESTEKSMIESTGKTIVESTSKTIVESTDKTIVETTETTKNTNAIKETNDEPSAVVDTVTNSIEDKENSLDSKTGLTNNNVVETATGQSSVVTKIVETPTTVVEDNTEKIDDCEVIEVPVKKKQKVNRRSWRVSRQTANSQVDVEEKENVRHKRKTAMNAEEIIRKEFLGNSDVDSIDSTENLVAFNYTRNMNNLRSASPPTLKRNYVDGEDKIESSTLKKLKQDSETNGDVIPKSDEKITNPSQTLAHVRRFFRRENGGKMAKLKQEELEELLIQKVVETITMRDEIGKLREQAKISERNQEATRLKCQQLAKQIKDFEMVLNRYQTDRRANPDKTTIPIKINRSVGLQVNFVTDNGIQNLRQLGQIQKPIGPIANGTSTTQQPVEQSPSQTPVTIPKRTIKVRSPRRSDANVTGPTITPVTTPIRGQQPIVQNIGPPTPLVVAKTVADSRTPIVTTVQHTTVPHPIAPKQTIVVNGPVVNQPIRQANAIQVSKPKNNDLIDLTQEEDKTKITAVTQNAIMTKSITESTTNASTVQKIAPRYHTVIQALPGSVAISSQSGIRVVQPSSQPTPTALVNNMNAPRLTYVMQGGMVPARQVVVTSTPTPIRPAPSIRTSYPLTGTITNGTVRVIPMASAATIQVYKHPAPLPEFMNAPSNPSWRLPPPAPSLKISKVSNGIVLSWNMALNEKFADIASYQLYAYQEVSGIAPSSSLWKKVGDVRALPLPMACTLTQFSEGNNYYFAVRAVDKHSRFGFYSQPGNISL